MTAFDKAWEVAKEYRICAKEGCTARIRNYGEDGKAYCHNCHSSQDVRDD